MDADTATLLYTIYVETPIKTWFALWEVALTTPAFGPINAEIYDMGKDI